MFVLYASIYLSLACYVLVIAARIFLWARERKPAGRDSEPKSEPKSEKAITKLWPWLWLLGVFFFWIHAAAAFHFVHHWRHAEAVRHTAERTQEVVGFAFGGGVYFNYAFGVIWTLHAVFTLAAPQRWRRQPRWLRGAIQAYLAFIVINGAVVFV